MEEEVRYSANEFAKAMQVAESNQVQAQAMEQVNTDVVDIINQVRELVDEDFAPAKVPLKTVDDVKFVVATTASALRQYRARLAETPEGGDL
jgi:hypothetical protein